MTKVSLILAARGLLIVPAGRAGPFAGQDVWLCSTPGMEEWVKHGSQPCSWSREQSDVP